MTRADTEEAVVGCGSSPELPAMSRWLRQVRSDLVSDLSSSPVLERLGGAHHVIVEPGDPHHEGGWELGSSGGPAAGSVVALQDAAELSGLVYRSNLVLSY